MRDEIPAIREAGADIAFIGNGLPLMAADFQKSHPVDAPVLVDPERKAFAAAGLRRGARATMNFRTVRNAVRAFRGGHRQGRTQGDPWQQGGVLLVDTDGQVRWRYVSREAGDHPSPAEILAAIEASRASGVGLSSA